MHDEGFLYTVNYVSHRKLQIWLENPCFSNVPLKNPIPYSHLPTKRTKIFGKTLQTPVQDRKSPLGLWRGKHDDDDDILYNGSF